VTKKNKTRPENDAEADRLLAGYRAGDAWPPDGPAPFVRDLRRRVEERLRLTPYPVGGRDYLLPTDPVLDHLCADADNPDGALRLRRYLEERGLPVPDALAAAAAGPPPRGTTPEDLYGPAAEFATPGNDGPPADGGATPAPPPECGEPPQEAGRHLPDPAADLTAPASPQTEAEAAPAPRAAVPESASAAPPGAAGRSPIVYDPDDREFFNRADLPDLRTAPRAVLDDLVDQVVRECARRRADQLRVARQPRPRAKELKVLAGRFEDVWEDLEYLVDVLARRGMAGEAAAGAEEVSVRPTCP
jgi:hypothetical protein